MILASLDLADVHRLEFGMKIAGTTAEPTSCRFVIQGSQYDINCKCTKNGETVEVEVPKLKTVLVPGVYKVRLEAVLHDRLFTPVNEELEFKAAIDALATTVKSGFTTRALPTPEIEIIQQPTGVAVNPVVSPTPSMHIFDLYDMLNGQGELTIDEAQKEMLRAVSNSKSWTNIKESFTPRDVQFEQFTDTLYKCRITGKQGKDVYVLETVINGKKVIESQSTFTKEKVKIAASFKDYLGEATTKKGKK